MPSSRLQDFALFLVVFFPVLSTFVVALRIYSRVSMGHFAADDWLIVVAMLMAAGETFATWGYIKTNFVGIHLVDVPEHDPTLGMKYNFAVQVLYNPILALVKNSVLVFLLRLSGHRQSVRYSVLALIALNTAMMVSIFIVVIFQCEPITFNWDPSIEGGRCIEQGVFYVSTAAMTLVTDVLVLSLPVWIVAGLRMARRTKIAVIGIFFLGIVVTIIGIGRLAVLIRTFFRPPKADYTYDIGFTLSTIETNLAIVTASAPAMKPLLRRWFPRLFSSLAHPYAYPDEPYGAFSPAGGASTRTHTHENPHYHPHKGRNRTSAAFEMRSVRMHMHARGVTGGESEDEIATFDHHAACGGIVKTTDIDVRTSVRYAEGGKMDEVVTKSKTNVTTVERERGGGMGSWI